MEKITIRDMTHNDLAQVLAIENRCFTSPWPLTSFQHEITNRDAVLKVAVINDNIAGYTCIRSILDVTHVLDLAVQPGTRRRGIATRLLRQALEEIKQLKPDTREVTLEVRKSNLPAIKLYESRGFCITGARPHYYKNPVEDAVIMNLDLSREAPGS